LGLAEDRHIEAGDQRLLKKPVNKAAGEKIPEAYPLGYVEDFFEPRTKLAGFFSSRYAVSLRVSFR
jgi:hypothetical protein